MHIVLGVAMLLGAASCLFCTAFRGCDTVTTRVARSVAMAVMLATMIEMSIGSWVVPQLLWCVILLFLIPVPFIGARRPYGSMAVQRALTIVAMFALLVISGPGVRTGTGSPLGFAGHAHGRELAGGGGWVAGNWLLGVGIILFLAFSVAIAAGAFRESIRQTAVIGLGASTSLGLDSAVHGRPGGNELVHLSDRVEAASSAFAIAAMALMVL